MKLDEYQTEAETTDFTRSAYDGTNSDLIVPLLGLAGEVGGLHTEVKKFLRDGSSYRIFDERIKEELGDILWYVSILTSKFGFSLEDVARLNLEKSSLRWRESSVCSLKSFDEAYPESERFPRNFVVRVENVQIDGVDRMQAFIDGEQVGDALTDNARSADGYRFHDVFHYAFAGVLGWSPVLRALLGIKRKSDPRVDEVEDGARAGVLEEGVAAIIFQHAEGRSFFRGVEKVDYELLRTIQMVTSNLEVSVRTPVEWEQAILQGFSVWRTVNDNNGGLLSVDLDKRSLRYVEKA